MCYLLAGVAMNEQRSTDVMPVRVVLWVSTVATGAVFIAFREATVPKMVIVICLFCCGVGLLWDTRK